MNIVALSFYSAKYVTIVALLEKFENFKTNF